MITIAYDTKIGSRSLITSCKPLPHDQQRCHIGKFRYLLELCQLGNTCVPLALYLVSTSVHSSPPSNTAGLHSGEELHRVNTYEEFYRGNTSYEEFLNSYRVFCLTSNLIYS